MFFSFALFTVVKREKTGSVRRGNIHILSSLWTLEGAHAFLSYVWFYSPPLPRFASWRDRGAEENGSKNACSFKIRCPFTMKGNKDVLTLLFWHHISTYLRLRCVRLWSGYQKVCVLVQLPHLKLGKFSYLSSVQPFQDKSWYIIPHFFLDIIPLKYVKNI